MLQNLAPQTVWVSVTNSCTVFANDRHSRLVIFYEIETQAETHFALLSPYPRCRSSDLRHLRLIPLDPCIPEKLAQIGLWCTQAGSSPDCSVSISTSLFWAWLYKTRGRLWSRCHLNINEENASKHLLFASAFRISNSYRVCGWSWWQYPFVV